MRHCHASSITGSTLKSWLYQVLVRCGATETLKHYWWEWKSVQSLWKWLDRHLKWNQHLPHDPSIPFTVTARRDRPLCYVVQAPAKVRAWRTELVSPAAHPQSLTVSSTARTGSILPSNFNPQLWAQTNGGVFGSPGFWWQIGLCRFSASTSSKCIVA